MQAVTLFAKDVAMFEVDSSLGRVLVVDDSEELRGLYSSLLLSEGYEVVLAVDGVDAMDQLIHHFFDVVILDHRMPRMSGLEVLKQLLKLERANPPRVLMVSSDSDADLVDTAIALGAAAYLIKGELRPEELLTTILRTRATLAA